MKVDFLKQMILDSRTIEHKQELIDSIENEEWEFEGKVHEVTNLGDCINLKSKQSSCWLSHVPISYFSKKYLLNHVIMEKES